MNSSQLIHKFKINPERIVVVYNAVADYFRDFSDNPEVLDKYKIEKNQVYEIMTEEEAAPMTGQGHGDEGKVEFIVEGPVCVTLRIVE